MGNILRICNTDGTVAIGILDLSGWSRGGGQTTSGVHTHDWIEVDGIVKLAVASNTGASTIYVADVDLTSSFSSPLTYSDFTQISDGSTTAYAPAWSPDGTEIACAYGPGAAHVGVFNVEDKTLERTIGDGGDYPDWSTEDKIAYHDATGALHVMDADGYNDAEVFDGPAKMVAWSPDCKKIAYVNAFPGKVWTCSYPYVTIQAAIEDSNDGDTIEVAGGTYPEGITTIDKDLDFVGDPSNKPVIIPTTDTGGSDTDWGWFTVSEDVTVNFENFVFDGTGQKIYAALYYMRDSEGGLVKDCDFKDIKYAQYFGRAIINYGYYVETRGCTFERIERIGVYTGYGESLIDECTYTGKGVGEWLDYAFEVGRGATVNIEEITVTDCLGVAYDGSTSAGVYVHGYYNEPGTITTATIMHSTISHTTSAIAVGYEETDNSVVVAHYNDLSLDNEYGVESFGPLVDATDNYWGTTDINDITEMVRGNVMFAPWLESEGGEPVENSVSDPVESGPGTVNATEEADTEIEYEATGNATVTVTELDDSPEEESSFLAIGKYVDVYISDPEALTTITIKVYYDPDNLGDFLESNLIMYWYDGTTWSPCSDTGVNVDENYIYAIINETTSPSLDDMMGTPFGPGGSGIGLDANYYRRGDTVIVQVADADANEDPLRRETMQVHVISSHDVAGIEVTLTETGVDTGVFTGSFPLVPTTPEPGDDELGVVDGDIITATYDGDTAEATVDDSAPTNTNLNPVDGSLITDAKPEITAEYADVGSGINVDSVVMKVDGEEVTTSFDTDIVSYTPETALTDGIHIVTVNVADNLGNEAETAIWNFTVDATEPTVEVSVSPGLTKAGNVTFTLTFSEEMNTTVAPAVTFTPLGGTPLEVLGDWTVDSTTEWVGTYTVTNATGDGEATISISDAEDLAGKQMEEDTSNTFVIDTTAPTAPIEVKLILTQNIPGTNDTISGEAGAVEANSTVYVYSDMELIDYVQAAEDGSFPIMSIGDNAHSEIWVNAMDAAGNAGTATSKMNDVEAPGIISVDWTATEDPVRTNETITVTIVGDPECIATFDIGTVAVDQPMVEDPEGTYVGVYIVGLGDDGSWTVTGTLTDEHGNPQSVDNDTQVNVLTDEEDPVFTSADIIYPVGIHSARVGDNVTIQATVSDTQSGVKNVTIDVYDEKLSLNLVDGVWTITFEVQNETLPGTYVVLFTATDNAGNEANTTVNGTVTTYLTGYNVKLDEGWNLISLPLIPDDPSIETVLGDAALDTEVVWSYDASAKKWYAYSPESPEASDLTTMVDGKGYWIKTTEETTLAVEGVEEPLPPQTPPQYAVVEGWNLVGFKETTDWIAEDYLAGIDGEYVNIYTYEDGAFRHLTSDDTFEPGRGYWLAVTNEGYIYP